MYPPENPHDLSLETVQELEKEIYVLKHDNEILEEANARLRRNVISLESMLQRSGYTFDWDYE